MAKWSSALILVCAVLILSIQYAEAQKNSIITAKNFTQQFSADWLTFDNGDGVQRLRMSLRLYEVDYSNWALNGQNGVWVGVGWGSDKMAGSDIIMCNFKLSSASNNVD